MADNQHPQHGTSSTGGTTASQESRSAVRNPTTRPEADADRQRRDPARREYTTASGTPRYAVQPSMGNEANSTSLEGDPSPGTPDNQLTDAQRKQREKLRQNARQSSQYDGRGNVSEGDGSKQTSGVTGVSTTGGVATVTTGPAPEGTPNPSDAGNGTGSNQSRTGAQRATGGESGTSGTASSGGSDGKR